MGDQQRGDGEVQVLEPCLAAGDRGGRLVGAGRGEHLAVLVPAATLALWEHWAPTAYPTRDAGDVSRAGTEKLELAHPAEFGAFTLFRRRVGGRTAVARGGVVVAELLDPDEAHWLQERARNVRQGFMDPKQKAAFEEFLARQPSIDEQ
ncbi:hypothetical protein ACFW9M_02930 [Streptomyces lydicus]|uniref:hypothetical protein n=1 Tax=Streptomyces lydicus TaxID=47763 RepID=UPI0036C86691